MRVAATIIFVMVNFMVFGMLDELYLPYGQPGRLAIVGLLCFVVVLAHELGHAIVAHRLGAVVLTIRVFFVHLQLLPRRVTFRVPTGGGDIGGHVTYSVVERWWTTRKDAMVAAAGPAANFALALATAPVAWLVSTRSGASLPSALVVLSVGMGLLNLLPFAGSDGSTILCYLRMRAPERR